MFLILSDSHLLLEQHKVIKEGQPFKNITWNLRKPFRHIKCHKGSF